MSEIQTTRGRSPEPSKAVHEVGDRPVLAPPVDIYENEQEYLVRADLPGVHKDDLALDLDKGELTLFAKRGLERPGETLAAGRREGDFRRVFRIPDEVDAGKVEASFEDGVLEVHLPKAERNKPRRITVKAVA